MPMDILVVPQSRWEELKDIPGLVYREALMNGKYIEIPIPFAAGNPRTACPC